ncbi:hypothetical protein KM043_015589 [Ampulex compressa]|nr:hypothetical protein KM043_015589 [Ampulex compressa]
MLETTIRNHVINNEIISQENTKIPNYPTYIVRSRIVKDTDPISASQLLLAISHDTEFLVLKSGRKKWRTISTYVDRAVAGINNSSCLAWAKKVPRPVSGPSPFVLAKGTWWHAPCAPARQQLLLCRRPEVDE